KAPRRERAPFLLVERGPCIAMGIRAQRFAHCDLLVGDPPIRVFAIEGAARDRGIHTEHRIERGNGPVRSECQGGVRVEQGSEGVGRFDAFWSDTLLDPAAVVRSEEHTSELQSVSISYAVFCLKKKTADLTANAS